MVWYLPDLTKSRQLWPAPPPAPALLEWARRFSHGAGTGASFLLFLLLLLLLVVIPNHRRLFKRRRCQRRPWPAPPPPPPPEWAKGFSNIARTGALLLPPLLVAVLVLVLVVAILIHRRHLR